ncbi:MAG: hypothetical protein UV98_C0032G0003 [Parcubacteria group bacterium GW2011_GWB1_43_6]|nr:MAG: hypothetical protein UV98_C0032G0003 [Parcubacteria group bacterium GW2011_GWB1_43_6]
MNKTLSFLSISAMVIAVLVVSANSSLAQTTTTSTTTASAIQAKLDAITLIMKQMDALKAQLAILQQQQKSNITDLITTLRQGSVGDNVKILQALLAADPSVYPEGLVTGFFGKLTAQAVKRFQAKYDIKETGGVVGEKTREKLNELLKKNPVSMEDRGEGNRPCAIVPPGHLIAPGWLKKHGGVRPIVPACQTLPPGIAAKLDTPAPTPTSTPDTVKPVISAVTNSVASTTATIVWTTNEFANSKVYYGTVNPLDLTSALTVSNNTLIIAHSLGLTALTASTTYQFVVQSADAANNIATSTQFMFTTLPQ